jgi:prevent-host-death family protein
MKEITIEQLERNAYALIDAAQSERLLVTQNGKPLALLVGIENKDQEDLALESSPAFWRMIEERRKEPTVALSAIKEKLLAGN